MSSFSSLFRRKCKLILHFPTMYAFCIYPAMSKRPNCAETSIVLIVSSVMSTLILLRFCFYYCNSTWMRYHKKIISWSVILHNKNSASQCSLTALIEPVQDEFYYYYYYKLIILAAETAMVTHKKKQPKKKPVLLLMFKCDHEFISNVLWLYSINPACPIT